MSLKYSKELYEHTEFYGCDEDEINHTQTLVKCRRSHTCVNCQKEINIGETALNETTIIQGEGYKSCYTCIECCDNWLDETEREEQMRGE